FEKTFERPGPKSVSPAMNCSGLEVVVWWKWIVDIASSGWYELIRPPGAHRTRCEFLFGHPRGSPVGPGTGRNSLNLRCQCPQYSGDQAEVRSSRLSHWSRYFSASNM